MKLNPLFLSIFGLETGMEIKEKVKELIADYLGEHNIELVDVAYRREQNGMTLRLLVDTAEGIKISECEDLNNFLSETLDREGVIDERYILEVASPGLDRPIRTDRDFERSMNKELEIATYEPIDGKKTHDGRLIGMDKETIAIESNGISTVIQKAKIAMARLKIKF